MRVFTPRTMTAGACNMHDREETYKISMETSKNLRDYDRIVLNYTYFKNELGKSELGRPWCERTGSFNMTIGFGFPWKQATLHLLDIINSSKNTLYHELN